MSKGGRLSRLFPKLFRNDRDRNENQGVEGKNPVCLVLFLDDCEQRISYKVSLIVFLILYFFYFSFLFGMTTASTCFVFVRIFFSFLFCHEVILM